MGDSTREMRSTGPDGTKPDPITVPTVRAILPQSADEPPSRPVASPPFVASAPADPTPMSDSTSLHTPPNLPVMFPGYQILGELGRGGMGVVYKARQRSLNRLVAFKVILAGPHASESDRARFRLEAEAGARLHHPNIAEVYDIGEHVGFAYIAFELVEGPTLRQWQAGRPVEPHTAARIIADVARAIQHAHEHGIVHRDIKPANILLGNAEWGMRNSEWKNEDKPLSSLQSEIRNPSSAFHQPKVTDFGLAKAMQGGPELTITGTACGTPNYMAPEQVRGRGVGPAVDVYALGAVLYELLAARPPFRGPDSEQVMEHILRSEPERVSRVNPDAPRDLEVIVAKCLEKDPARRYPSAAALADDLERYLAGRPISARAVGLAERTWRWCRRNPVVTAFLVFITVGFLLTGWLALALADAVSVERQAQDRLRIALAKEEAARKEIDAQKARALAQAEIAKLQTKRAEEEKDRANTNFRLARLVVRNTFREVAEHPRFRGPEFRELRENLLRTGGAFYKEFAATAGNDPDALAELAECARWLGDLELLNGNPDTAAVHYLASVDVCGRWSALDPSDPEPRVRKAESLLFAGQALKQAGRLDGVEAHYREAVALMEGVVERHPRVEVYLWRLVRSYGPLFELLRDQRRWTDGLDVCRVWFDRASLLVRRIGAKPEYLLAEARVRLCFGQMLDRTGQANEAEGHFLEAIALRERVRTQTPERIGWTTELKVEAARLQFTLAQHYAAFVGDSQRARAPIGEAVGLMEQVCKTEPNNIRYGIEWADYSVFEANLSRQAREFEPAEVRYDRAIQTTEQLLGRKLDAADTRAVKVVWAAAMTGRAHLYNNTGRQREAAAQWERLSQDDPNEAIRPQHALFVLQSLVFAKDWRKAAAGAEKLATGDPAPGLLADIARVWCRVSLLAAEDPNLSDTERMEESRQAIEKALACLERAKKAGLFKNAAAISFYEKHSDFEPVRNTFNPRD